MKKIVILFVFLSALSCSKSVSQVNSLKLISESAQVDLPYGDKNVLQSFPADWNHSENVVADSLYNSMSFYLFQDIQNPIRKKIKLEYSEAKSLLAKEFVPSKAVKNNKEKLEISVAKIFASKDFEMYSVMYQGVKDCNSCEFPEKQTQNILVTIKDGKIVEKLLISYFNGSDLSQETRYFYIDQNQTIQVKDFKSDEEGVTSSKQIKYKLSSKGNFLQS